MPSVDLTHINAALTRIGEDPITSLTQGGAAANTALNNYENLVKAALCSRFRFATKIETLNLLDPDVHGDPPEPWGHAYQLPTTDLLQIRTVKSGGVPIAYEKMGTKVFCDVGEDADVIAVYVWRVPEAQWPPDFAEALTIQLEALFLRAVGERHDEAKDRDKDARRAFSTARTNDSQSQTPVDPMASPTLAARRGVVGSRSRVTIATNS